MFFCFYFLFLETHPRSPSGGNQWVFIFCGGVSSARPPPSSVIYSYVSPYYRNRPSFSLLLCLQSLSPTSHGPHPRQSTFQEDSTTDDSPRALLPSVVWDICGPSSRKTRLLSSRSPGFHPYMNRTDPPAGSRPHCSIKVEKGPDGLCPEGRR